MKIETLIHPNDSVGGHRPMYRFISRPFMAQSRLTPPPQYAMVGYVNGRLDRIEYDSLTEYKRHRDAISAKVAALHSRSGKREGCNCTFCGGGR